MALMGISPNWVENMIINMKMNGYPHPDFMSIDMPVEYDKLKNSNSQYFRVLSKTFNNSHYIAIVLPDNHNLFLPNFIHTIHSYNDFVKFNNMLERRYEQVKNLVNYNNEPDMDKSLKVVFIQYFPKQDYIWFRLHVNKSNPKDRVFTLSIFYNSARIEPFVLHDNKERISVRIYYDRDSVRYYLPNKIDDKEKERIEDIIRKVLTTLSKHQQLLVSLQDKCMHDIVVYNKSIKTKYFNSMRKVNILVYSIIPVDIINKTRQKIHEINSMSGVNSQTTFPLRA